MNRWVRGFGTRDGDWLGNSNRDSSASKIHGTHKPQLPSVASGLTPLGASPKTSTFGRASYELEATGRSSGEEGLGDSGRSQLLTEVGDGFGTPGDFISRFPAACVTFWGPLLENEPAVESWYGLVGAPRLKHSV
jgi:hypothetical protein